jgi:hypothetical protein
MAYSPYGRGMSGRYSMDTDNHPIKLRTAFQQPINILPHNLYLASQVPLVNPNVRTVNALTLTGLLIASTYTENGLKYAIGAGALLWGLWIFDMPRGTRIRLSSVEFHGLLQ